MHVGARRNLQCRRRGGGFDRIVGNFVIDDGFLSVRKAYGTGSNTAGCKPGFDNTAIFQGDERGGTREREIAVSPTDLLECPAASGASGRNFDLTKQFVRFNCRGE